MGIDVLFRHGELGLNPFFLKRGRGANRHGSGDATHGRIPGKRRTDENKRENKSVSEKSLDVWDENFFHLVGLSCR